MKYTHRELTGRLRIVDRTEFVNDVTAKNVQTLQQEYRCWNVKEYGLIEVETDEKMIWENVPIVKITEL